MSEENRINEGTESIADKLDNSSSSGSGVSTASSGKIRLSGFLEKISIINGYSDDIG